MRQIVSWLEGVGSGWPLPSDQLYIITIRQFYVCPIRNLVEATPNLGASGTIRWSQCTSNTTDRLSERPFLSPIFSGPGKALKMPSSTERPLRSFDERWGGVVRGLGRNVESGGESA